LFRQLKNRNIGRGLWTKHKGILPLESFGSDNLLLNSLKSNFIECLKNEKELSVVLRFYQTHLRCFLC